MGKESREINLAVANFRVALIKFNVENPERIIPVRKGFVLFLLHLAPRTQSSLFFIAALLCVSVRHAGAQRLGRSGEPSFPPGVSLIEEIPAEEFVPVGVRVRGVRIDWMEPRLAVEVVVGIGEGGAPARGWDNLMRDYPDALVVQLAEPFEAEDKTWSTAAPFEIFEAREPQKSSATFIVDPPDMGHMGHASQSDGAAPSLFAQRDHLAIGGILPWLYAGPSAEGGVVPPSVLGEGSSRVGLRWLGRAEDWRARLPRGTIRDRVMLSTVDPARGRTSLYLILNETGSRLGFDALGRWIEKAFAPERLLAVHAADLEARVTAGDWTLARDNHPARRKRVGVALILRPKRQGESINWLLVEPSRVSASSSRGDEPGAIVLRPLWPQPLAVAGWMSDPGPLKISDGASGPWIDIAFENPRPVETIRLIYAEADGFSVHFNPERLDLYLAGVTPGGSELHIPIDQPRGAYSTVRLPGGRVVSRLKIEISVPNRFGVPGAARLAGVQMFGPWDGSEPFASPYEVLHRRR